MRKKISLLFFAWVLVAAIAWYWYDLGADSYSDNDPVPVAWDEYDFSLKLKVPQVCDNSSSLGYRAFQLQRIKGKMYIVWLDNGSFQVKFSDLMNRDFKVRGAYVNYEGLMDTSIYPRYNYIGNNKTDRFTTPCICFSAMYEPSYAMGGATEDNSFILAFSAKGYSTFKKKLGCTVATRFFGYAVGHQGCACMNYGHKSPTRKAAINGPCTLTDDVVATYGTWSAKWKCREYLQ